MVDELAQRREGWKSILLLAVLAGCAILAACSSPKESSRSKMPPADVASNIDDPAARLDSLVAHSHGDYLHMVVSQCFGRCEAHISLYRGSPAEFHIYDAEAWVYNEFQRSDILYRMRRPMVSDKAEALIARADELGIMRLVNDTTYRMTDQPYIWVRARIGTRKVSVNHAYLGGEKYASDGTGPSLAQTYVSLRGALLAPLVADPNASK